MATNEDKMEYIEEFDHNLIEDHEYDGIRELDNPPPFWLMSLFYLSVIFSVAYGAYYFWLGMGDLQAAEYEKEVAAAQLNQKAQPENAFDENNIVLFTDDENLKAGAELFATKTCTTCHGQHGEGNAIGPNLADEYWIHGNTPNELFQIIKNGVPTKGMTPFKGQLSPEQMVQVLSYVLLKIQKSNPENAKEPQGEKIGFYGANNKTAEQDSTTTE